MSTVKARLKRVTDFFWPIIGIVAVVWSLKLLYQKLQGEVAGDPVIRKMLDDGGLWSDLKVIAFAIGQKLSAIPPESYLLAVASTLVAYAALAWYDRIALHHLNKQKGIGWGYIAACSFVTYAFAHNIGASVLSGGMVRLRAYTAKGLTAAEVAVLVAMCSFTFAFGTIILVGIVFTFEPQILKPLVSIVPKFAASEALTVAVGIALLAFCLLYVLGSWLNLRPLKIGSFEMIYPRLPVVVRQCIAAPLELIGAAGIIYFALPAEGNPGFFIVMGAFLLSFSAGLLSQVPGGVGVMEAVFLAIMPGVPATAVIAALLVWRLLYLLVPLALSVPVVLLFEKAQLRKGARE
jgi:hypothetical protein